MLTSIARRFHAWKRYGKATQELSLLSDRDLADIGISRSEIARIAWEHALCEEQNREAIHTGLQPVMDCFERRPALRASH
jgi:uncharacterized protein YjiS (DUF1127 family)